jgi:hypothetical protein
MHISNTNQTIEAFVEASERVDSDPRHRHVLRESLRSLVRQAKAEQLLEVRRNAARASGFTIREYARLMPRMRRTSWPGQGELEFGGDGGR